MNDKSRIAAIALCFLMIFQAQAYAEENKTYSLTSKENINFDGTSGETSLEAGDVLTYAPENGSAGNFAKIILPKGEYKLECYGCKSSDNIPGGYSSGTFKPKNIVDIYLYCGGHFSKGDSGSKDNIGYNGGGTKAGGATHIATEEGLLTARKQDYKETLLMVAGGAGAGGGGTGGGESGTEGNGYGTSGSMNYNSVVGSYTAAGGGTQKGGGSGCTVRAGSKYVYGGEGSFGKGGSGGYGGGGGFYGGGSGATQITSGKWVKWGNESNYISATAYAYGAGGSGYINENYITDGKTEKGKKPEPRTSGISPSKGKIIITCLDINNDYHSNKLYAPSKVASGSVFAVRSESEINTKYKTIIDVRYQIKSGENILLEKKATLEGSQSQGDISNQKYSSLLQMPYCNKNPLTLEAVITYSNGEKISLTREITSVSNSNKDEFWDEIRYVGQGCALDEDSKWMTDKDLNEKLTNSINKTEPEEVRNLN